MWSGRIGGWCAVLANASGTCECAVLAWVACVSLHSRLFSPLKTNNSVQLRTVRLEKKNYNTKEEGEKM